METQIKVMGKCICNDCGVDAELLHVCITRHYGVNDYSNNLTLCRYCINKRQEENEDELISRVNALTEQVERLERQNEKMRSCLNCFDRNNCKAWDINKLLPCVEWKLEAIKEGEK
jgi:hypothetical protein